MTNSILVNQKLIDDWSHLDYFTSDEWSSVFIRACKFYYEKCLNVSYGRNRLAFVFDTYVFKVPCCEAGCGDNDWEGSVQNTIESFNNYEYIQYPKTELFYFEELPICKMELVTQANSKEIKSVLGFVPDWIYSIDCQQVGFTVEGRLVAYDYGLN